MKKLIWGAVWDGVTEQLYTALGRKVQCLATPD